MDSTLYGEHSETYPRFHPTPPLINSGFSDDEFRALMLSDLQTSIARLSNAGKNVYLVAPVPEIRNHVENLIFEAEEAELYGPILGTSLDYYSQRNAEVMTHLISIAKKYGAKVIYPSESFCDDSACTAVDGESFYFDDNHLSVVGAEKLVGDNLEVFGLQVDD